MHFVEALFAHEHPMEHGRNHQIREGLLRGNRRYDEIWKHYRPLKDASCVARYLASAQGTEYRTFADYATIDQVRHEFVDHRLRHVEASVLKLIASPPDRKNRNR
ncbi:MAG: hypothetical protein NTV86_13595 [Planctomycetota bacterium]|nr:hypothetical protein [Planctomycetota bacterium]